MKKIVDIFDFNGEFDLLDFKLKYNESFIADFWVSDLTSEKSLQDIINNKYSWLSKKVRILPNINKTEYDENLYNLFKTSDVGFDDTIILSKIEDVYRKEFIDELDLHLPFGPHFFSMSFSNEEFKKENQEPVVGPVAFHRTIYTSNPIDLGITFKEMRGERKIHPKYILPNAGYKVRITKKEEDFIFTLD